MTPEWLTIPEAAKRIHRGRTTIYEWIAAGLDSQKVGRARYVRLDRLRTWQRDHARRTGRARDDY